MDTNKKGLKKGVLFLILVLFPFGQLLRLETTLLQSYRVVLNILDVLVLVSLFLINPVILKLTQIKYFKNIIFALCFSLVYSLSIFPISSVLTGFMYSVRLMVYLGLILFILTILKEKIISPFKLINYFLGSIVMTGVFGWVQYLIYPDIRFLSVWNWDDHLFRLTGTFFDPGLFSIILVIGFIISLSEYLRQKSIKYVLVCLFLLTTLAFTYSRAGYLSFLIGILVYFFLKGKKKIVLMIISVFCLIILFLPRPSSEGVKLERLYSIEDRFENYQETLVIWKSNPLFGIGYNNLCLSRNNLLGYESVKSHSCYGSDSSILLILATTGIVGFMIISKNIIGFLISLRGNKHYPVLLSSSIALLVHSQFNNSIFYPWVLILLMMLSALAINTSSKSGH